MTSSTRRDCHLYRQTSTHQGCHLYRQTARDTTSRSILHGPHPWVPTTRGNWSLWWWHTVHDSSSIIRHHNKSASSSKWQQFHATRPVLLLCWPISSKPGTDQRPSYLPTLRSDSSSIHYHHPPVQKNLAFLQRVQVLSYATLLSFLVFVHSCHLPANLVLSIVLIPRAPTERRVKGAMQKVLLDWSYVLGFNLAIIVLIIKLFIYLW